MLHGHCGPAAVKPHTYALAIEVPLLFCAPDTVAVYVVLFARELVGVNVATVLAVLKLTEPGTVVPPESLSVNETVLGVTAWENVTVGVTDTATPVAPSAGVTLVTAGGASGVTALDADESGPVRSRWSRRP